jgi:hypothetical protein
LRWKDPAAALVQFDLDTINVGTLNKEEVISVQYSFVNTGVDDLLIYMVSACDCMETAWTETAIKPGARGYIDIWIDPSRLTPGLVEKEIDVIFRNTDERGYPIVARAVLKGIL